MIYLPTLKNLLKITGRLANNKKFHKSILSYVLACIGCLTACQQNSERKPESKSGFNLYSNEVKDTFSIYIQKPLEYEEKAKSTYPLVVVTDANFYFPMLAPIVHQFEQTGLMKPIILVGVGYDSLEKMDSLRVRDFLYPHSIASDEMQAEGGARRFQAFLANELLPGLADSLRLNTDKVLLGHSFGGYFSLLTYFEQVRSGASNFNKFVSASPTIWYNDFYLNRLTDSLKNNGKQDSTAIYLSVGGLEDSVWYVKPAEVMAEKLSSDAVKNLDCTSITYREMDHMDVGLFSFIHALKNWYKQD
ncbi:MULTISPECIES: alpha/beta hydrolase [Olivibacter]|uniref:Alpha/beta hydrolase n=1 Tax=Olivibacter oleidegradans TaxID=760123 RepID=A0ABV6HES0_9SPHI|nr:MULTISPECIES: alpha/beta hydrolase-fold protein [Olivibacter]QEK99876.1 alpha/beta hydrolase [Olivibacter sp. LS-1]